MAKVKQERQISIIEEGIQEDEDSLLGEDVKELDHDILQESHNDDDLMLELEEFVNS